MCYNVKRMCIKSSPRREGRNYRDSFIIGLIRLIRLIGLIRLINLLG